MGSKWIEIPLASILSTPGWHYNDVDAFNRLVSSHRRYGQLRPLVVASTEDDLFRIVEGRQRLAVMQHLGWSHARAIDIGIVPTSDEIRVALALECRQRIDFAALASRVADLVEAGVTPEEIALTAPFSVDRIGGFARLARFDWAQFSSTATDQVLLDWSMDSDDEMGSVSVPADATASELIHEAEIVAPETPVAEVVESLRAHRRRHDQPGQMLIEF